MKYKISKKIKYLLVIYILLLQIFIFDYPKKIISRLIFSHDLSLLQHSVFKKINEKTEFDMRDQKNNKQSLIILNNYVNNFFKYTIEDLDDNVSWKMLHGSILCDGVTDIFLRLAEATNTNVAMVFLYDDNGSSPHTLAFADLKNRNPLWEDENLGFTYIFDPQANIYPINSNNQLININYMIDNKHEFKNIMRLHSDEKILNLLINQKKVFQRNRIENDYSFITKFSFNLIQIIPEYFMKKIYKFGIIINPDIDKQYKKLLIARLELILLNYEMAKLELQNIVNKKTRYRETARYWYDLLNNNKLQLNIDQEKIILEFSNINFK